jgi:spore maturation protein CgeB
MRYLRFSTFYPEHIAAFYAAKPELATQPYAAQSAALWADGFNWFHYLGRELRALGYDAVDFAADVEPLQRQWAAENGVTVGANWQVQIAAAQIAAFRPDILFAPSFGPDAITHFLTQYPFIRLVIGWAGEPIRTAGFFRAHHLMLTCVPEHVAYYRQAGLPTEHLLHAFEPSILQKLDATPQIKKDSALGFVGSVKWGDYAHTQRAQFLYDLSQETRLTLLSHVPDIIAGYFAPPDTAINRLKRPLQQAYYQAMQRLSDAGLQGLIRHLPRYAVYERYARRVPYLRVYRHLAQIAEPPVFGMRMYATLRRMQVTLNGHAWSAYASNMRLFEATGVGTCLLTDWKQNIADIFVPGDEVVTYRSTAEAAEKARYLLAHPADAARIAAAGQQRTLRDHTTRQRAAEFDAIVRRYV